MSFLGGILLFLVPVCLCVNLVDQPGAYGPDVVATVIDKIRSICILPEDKLFLRRLAFVETRDGSLPLTYGNPNFDGGIWQVTRDMLRVTQKNQPIMRPLYNIIRRSLHIDWQQVQWKDLRKPLYSGVAAALYLTLETNKTASKIPLKIEEQGTFWRDHYHTGGRPYNYTAVVEELQLGCHVSQRQIDLAFIVDSSSSMSPEDFQRVKNFLLDTIKGFSIGHSTTHVAVITYSSKVTVEFPLNRYYSRNDVDQAIQNVKYKPGATNTASALDSAVSQIFSTAKGGRGNAVKVAVLITDGRSDDEINTKNAAQQAHNNGIAMFTVGVGDKIDASELSEIATPPTCTHAFSADGYESIANLKQEIQASVCRAPLYANQTITCEVDKCPPYAFPFTGTNGITIKGRLDCGTANLYADVNNYYPSSTHSILSKVIGTNGIVAYQAKPDQNSDFLYVTIQDINGRGCNITMTPLVGDKTVHNVDVICREEPSKKERQCGKPDLIQFRPLICNGPVSVPSIVCTTTDAINGALLEFPGDNTRYVRCLPNGQYQIINCPANNVFDPKCKVCYGASAPKVDCSQPTPVNITNPCTAQNLLNNKFYFNYPGDHNKYIQCNIWGHPFVRHCQPGDVWVEEHVTCETPDTNRYNPCSQMTVTGQRFYAYPPDTTQFIECVDTLNPQILNCTRGQVWDDCDKTCVPIGRPFCGNSGSSQINLPSVSTSTGAVIGKAFAYPCTRDHLVNNQLYFPDPGNKSNYIQCDLTGLAYRKSCPSGRYFDPNSDTCVDGSVFIDGNLNPKAAIGKK